jgi:hypothetical protein
MSLCLSLLALTHAVFIEGACSFNNYGSLIPLHTPSLLSLLTHASALQLIRHHSAMEQPIRLSPPQAQDELLWPNEANMLYKYESK